MIRDRNGWKREEKHTIYVFCNSCSPEWHSIVAIGDDGQYAGGHFCSDHYFIHHDMGFSGDWKHDVYDRLYGEGNWTLELVENPRKGNCEGLDRAYALNQEAAAREK